MRHTDSSRHTRNLTVDPTGIFLVFDLKKEGLWWCCGVEETGDGNGGRKSCGGRWCSVYMEMGTTEVMHQLAVGGTPDRPTNRLVVCLKAACFFLGGVDGENARQLWWAAAVMFCFRSLDCTFYYSNSAT